jgi:PPP family 3-phenylpropionic acid transporter
MFMAVGVSLPFFPQYYRSLGFSGPEVGLLLAVGPVFAMVAPPLWGQLADRTGRAGLVLGGITAGAFVGYFALWSASTFWWVLLALCLHNAFGSAMTTMIDTLALREIERHGGSYSALRIFGSLGFVVASLGYGFSVDVIDRRAITAALVAMGGAAVWAWVALARAPAVHSEGPRASFGEAIALLKRKDVGVFLLATALHWIACAPYHGTLSMFVTALQLPPWVVSTSSSVGVAAEVAVMFTWPRWGHRLSSRTLLIVSFVASAVRWVGMSLFHSGPALIALAAIHGLTFGAFYLASVAYMAERAPGSMRATGQALFVAATFGIGGLVGYLCTGAGYDALGGARLFLIAGGAALLPALLLAMVDPRAPSRSGVASGSA